MPNARGNNKAGSPNEYEQERLENIKRIKRRFTDLNIAEIVKDIGQQGLATETLKVCFP
jgi:hypothetical protein